MGNAIGIEVGFIVKIDHRFTFIVSVVEERRVQELLLGHVVLNIYYIYLHT